MIATTLSDTAYNEAKAKAINNRIIRKELNLSEFEIEKDCLIIDGTQVRMTEGALGKLMRRMRIPKKFADRFKDGFGDDGLKQLLNMMKSIKVYGMSKDVTLIVDPDKREVTDVLPSGYGSISNESFINFTEEYLSKYNLEPTSFGSFKGGATINTLNPNSIFQIPGLKDEVFQTGLSFRNSPSRGLEVSPYMNRLACANGMTSTVFSENFQLSSLNDKDIQKFNEHMINLAAGGFQPSGYVDKIKKAVNTNASLAEVQSALNNIVSSDKNVSWEYCQRYLPQEAINNQYKMVGVDTSTLTKRQRQMADSGMSIWEVSNAMTNFATHDQKFNINPYRRTAVQIQAGNLLMKKQYDLEGMMDINPFKGQQLLTQKQSDKIMGNLN